MRQNIDDDVYVLNLADTFNKLGYENDIQIINGGTKPVEKYNYVTKQSVRDNMVGFFHNLIAQTIRGRNQHLVCRYDIQDVE